jgi:hypothetical protein
MAQLFRIPSQDEAPCPDQGSQLLQAVRDQRSARVFPLEWAEVPQSAVNVC